MSFNFKGPERYILLLLGTFLVTSLSAQTTTYTWSGAGSTWAANGDWTSSGGTYPASVTADTAAFSGLTTAQTVNLGGTQSVNALTVAGTETGTTLIEGGGASEILNLGSGGLAISSGAAAVTIGSTAAASTQGVTIDLNASQSWANNSSAALTVDNGVTNVGNTTPYTLTLDGSGSGGTVFNGAISNGGSTGTTALIINTTSTGATTLAGNNTYSGGTTLTSGTLDINSTTALGTGAVNLNGGTIDDTNTALTLSNGNTINLGGAVAYTGSNALNLGAGAFNVSNAAAISSSQGTLTIGGNVTFAASSTFTHTDSSNTNVGNLLFSGGTWSAVAANTFTITGASYDEFNLANNTTVANNFVDNGVFRGAIQGYESSGVTNIFSGVTSGSDSNYFWQNGAGTSILTGNNTNTGAYYVGYGTLQIGNGTSGSVASGSTFNLTDGAAQSGSTGGTLAFDEANNSTISQALTTSGTVGTFIIAGVEGANITNTLSGVLSGPISFAQTGTGTTVLSAPATSPNTYTGSTTVSAGTLSLTGSLTGATAITVSGGTLSETSTGVLGSAAASISVTGGTVTLAGANTYSGTTSLSSGNLNINNASALGTGSLTLSGGTINATNGAITTPTNNPAIVLGGNFAFGGTNNLNLGTGAVTVGGSRTITLNGTGSTLTLGGTATDTVAGGATSGITTTVNGSGNTLALGALVLGSANTAAITDTFAGTGNVTITGAVTNGTAYANALAYGGGGVLTLAGNNTYTGATTVSSGTLVLSGVNTAATGALGVSSGATLQLVGDASNNGATSGNTNTSIGASTALTLSAGSTVQLRDNVSDTYAPASITTSGNGTFNFDVNNSTSGTGQTLTLAGAIGFGSGNQQINVTSSGTGYTLGLGALTFNTASNNGQLTFTINATTAATAISSFQYGGYGGNMVLEGGNNIAIGGLIFDSNGSENFTVAGANVSFNGATTAAGGRITGTYNVILNTGTLNLNNAGALSDPDGSTTTFTINGGELDNTSGGSITESGTPGVAIDGGFTFVGSNNLNLGTGIVTVSGYQTITSNAKTLTLGSLDLSGSGLTAAGPGNLTLGAGVTAFGAGNTLANSGSGTFALGGITNTNAGTLDITLGGGPITTTGTNGAGAGTLISIFTTVNSGADFAQETSGVISAPSGEVALPTTGTSGSIAYLTSGQTQAGAVTVAALRINDTNSDTLNVGSYGLTLGGGGGSGILYNGGPSGQYTISGTGYVGGGSGHSFDVNIYAGTLTISAPLIDAGATTSYDTLSKGGAGTLVLTAANTFGGSYGDVTVGGGTLDLGNGNTGSFTFQAGVTPILIESGATLGLGMVNGSAISDAITTQSGTINGIEASGVTNTYSGNIGTSTSIQTGGITQTGAGTTLLSGTNLYTGATAINAGAIEITNAYSLGGSAHYTSGVTVASGAALQMSGGISTAGPWGLTLNGTGLASEATPTGALESLSGANTYTGAITLGSNASIGADSSSTLALSGGVTTAGFRLTMTGAGNTTLSGVIGGSGSLAVSGTGTTTLSGASANVFTGETVVSNGELDLNKTAGVVAIQGAGAESLAAPDILVNGGALKFLAADQLANPADGSGDVTLSLTSGTVNLNGTKQTVYAFQNTGGTFTTGSSGGYLFSDGAGTTFGGGTNTITAGGTVEDSYFVISGGTNTVQGGTSATGGQLLLDGYSDIGGGTGIAFSNGANLTLNADSTSGDEGEILLANSGTYIISTAAASTTASITTTSGTYSGEINLDGNQLEFNTAAGTVPGGGPDLSVSAVIAGSGAGSGVYKTGAGILALSGANTYAGGTIISQGTLEAGVSNVGSTSGAFGPTNGTSTGLVTLGDSNTGTSSPTLLINTAGTTVSNPITVANDGTTATIGGVNTSGTATYTGEITLNKAVTLQAATGGTVDFKSGTWVTNNNAFVIGSSGNAGVVEVDNAISTTGGISVNYGSLNTTSTLTSNLAITNTATVSQTSGSTLTGSVNDSSSGNSTFSGLITGSGNTVTVSAGTMTLSAANGNTYSGGTTIGGGALYVENTSSTTSGTGSGSIAVNSGGTLAGSGFIAPTGGAGVTISSGATLASGAVQTGIAGRTGQPSNTGYNVTSSGLTFTNTEASSSLLTINGGAKLTFDLGAGTNTGYLAFSNPNTNSTYISLIGGTTDQIFSNTTTADNITLVDLTAYASTTTSNTVTLRFQNPYLLIATDPTGAAAVAADPINSLDADFANLWTTGGEGQNGYVLGVSTGVGNAYTAFNLDAVNINGTQTNSASNLQNLQLYLYNGDLEVVPEPETWALMLGGLALLIFIQRRRNKTD